MKSLSNSFKNNLNDMEKKEINKPLYNYVYFKSYKGKKKVAKNFDKKLVLKNRKFKLENNYYIKEELNNLLEVASSEIVSIKLLRNIGECLFNFLNADLMNIFIYDVENCSLIKNDMLEFGKSFCENHKDFEITKNEEYKIIHTEYYEGIKEIGAFQFDDKEVFIKNNIKYLGCYKIMNNDNLIGLLIIGYEKINDSINEKNMFIGDFCKKIGPIMSRCKLIEVLKCELRKRIELQKEMEIFLSSSKRMICIIDKKGYFQKVGPQCVNLLGWSEKEFLSMNYRELIIDEEFLNGFKVAENRPFINKYKTKNGEYKWLEINYKCIERNSFMVIAEDVTEEINLESKNETLENKVSLENAKNKLFTNISHDFKTPINIILATTQLILKKIDEEKFELNDNINLKKYMNSIRQNSCRLLKLVNNIMDMTKIDAGYFELHLANYDIVNLVEDTTMSVVEYAKYKGVDIIFDTNVEEKLISCDAEKIERIILNLLSNALKHTPLNGEVYVSLLEDGEFIKITVKDSGSGIEQENLDKIFDRYRQVDALLTQRAGGTGIGLSLVKSLVELHDGDISVKSESGKGAEFVVKLPNKTIDECSAFLKEDYNINSNKEKREIEFSDVYF